MSTAYSKKLSILSVINFFYTHVAEKILIKINQCRS